MKNKKLLKKVDDLLIKSDIPLLKIKLKSKDKITRMMGILELIWRKYPNLRLFQLMLNCFINEENTIYFMEDKQVEEKLKKVYKQAFLDV